MNLPELADYSNQAKQWAAAEVFLCSCVDQLLY